MPKRYLCAMLREALNDLAADADPILGSGSQGYPVSDRILSVLERKLELLADLIRKYREGKNESN